MDEIGDIPMGLQAKLLGFMENRSFRRVGGTTDMHVNVRIIAATNADLNQAMLRKDFRQDLYFRLNVITIKLPPLRERPGDLPMLLERFLAEEAGKLGMETPEISESGLAALEKHDWKGNIRELKSCCTRLAIYGGGHIDEEAVNLALDDDD